MTYNEARIMALANELHVKLGAENNGKALKHSTHKSGMNIYNNYAMLRDTKGFNDAQISAGTGITRSTFSDWKHGKYVPKIGKLTKIAQFLNVPLEALVKE